MVSGMAHLGLMEINAYDQATFVDRLGALFEKPPWIVAAGWAARPFADRAALHRALCAVMRAAPVERQVALLQAHPAASG
jgi:2-oxo-4-hydroxy-4-carboxy-5-ureidoimidazoline decarboxylase